MVYYFGSSFSELAEGFRGPFPGRVRFSVSGPLCYDGDGFKVFQFREPVEDPDADDVEKGFFAEVLLENVEGFEGPRLAEASRRLSLHVVASVSFIQDSYQRFGRVFIAKLA